MEKLSRVSWIMILTIMGGGFFYLFTKHLLVALLLLILGGLFWYLSKTNNQQRKENLNIIKKENELQFYLSDDIFFSMEIPKEKNFAKTIRNVVEKEIACLETTVRSINFINFTNKPLERELNEFLLKKSQK